MTLSSDIMDLMSDGKERSTWDIARELFPDIKSRSDLNAKKGCVTTTLAIMRGRGDITQTRKALGDAMGSKALMAWWRRDI